MKQEPRRRACSADARSAAHARLPAGRWLCSWALLLLLLMAVPAPAAPRWGSQSWSTENGLPQNSVHQVLQTSEGFLWVATEGGAAHFDGADFQIFNEQNTPALTTDDTCCLAQGQDGALWLGTADGLLREQGGIFRRFAKADGLPSTVILSLAASRTGSMLVLTAGGLVRIGANERIVPVPGELGAQATAIAAGEDGTLWAADGQGLFASSDGGRHFAARAGASATLPPAGLQISPDGSIWMWAAGRVDRMKGRQHTSWATGSQLPGTRVNSVTVDRDGQAWVGTNRGLADVDPASGAVHQMPQLGDTPILSALEDHEGNLWVGTENSGLTVLRPQAFRPLVAVNDRVITAVVQTTDGAAWVGTRDDGLWKAPDGVHAVPAAARQLASQIILSLAPGHKGDLWVGTPDGLNHVEGSQVHVYTSVDGLPDDFIRSLYTDKDGSLWVGTRRGLAHWQTGHVQVWTHADGLASDLIGALLHTDEAGRAGGDLWIATLDGVSRLSGGTLKTYMRAQGIPGNIITSLAQSRDGVVWVGTRDGGLAYFHQGRFVACRGPGLPHGIDSLVVDRADWLWMGSRHGLVRAPAAALEACGGRQGCTVSTHRFGVLDGMPSEEASTIGHPAAWRMHTGDLWFATRKGVAIVDPMALQVDSTVPPVIIENFAVDGLPRPQQSSDIRVKPGHASFTFHYAGLSYRAPTRVHYRYMLQGFDNRWTMAGDRRTAYYTNLPARHYTFRVQASKDGGAWSAPGASLRFVVLPPFYRRWWFYALVLFSIGAGIYLWHALRVRRLEGQFRAVLGERTRIAREIHDTLAQDLVGVSLQLETAAQLLAARDVPAAGEQLDQTRILVRQGLKDARASIWELRATAAEGTLPARLGRIAERSSDKTAVKVKVAGAYRPLSTKTEAELLRIAQEAVTNAIRHAQAATIQIALEYGAEQLVLRIEDDGQGFATEKVRGDHYGLQGMRERAASIGATFEVESRPDAGTHIRTAVPAKG